MLLSHRLESQKLKVIYIGRLSFYNLHFIIPPAPPFANRIVTSVMRETNTQPKVMDPQFLQMFLENVFLEIANVFAIIILSWLPSVPSKASEGSSGQWYT